MLTYLQALKHEKNEKIAFVDLDSSTQTSTRQLRFLAQQETNRLFSVDIFDHLKKIEREKLYDILQAFNSQPFDEIFYDFLIPILSPLILENGESILWPSPFLTLSPEDRATILACVPANEAKRTGDTWRLFGAVPGSH